jgi:3-(3-hydroxy-phenyl)propionate hydroxylase
VGPDTRARWQANGVVEIESDSEELRAWMHAQGVNAVMLRPDRYVMGVARSGAELDTLAGLLPARAARAHAQAAA